MLTSLRHGLLRQVIVTLLIWSIGLGSLAPAWAQQQIPAPGAGGGITAKICNPGVCMSKDEKARYAKENNCRFLEEVCEGRTTPETDNKGAVKDDSSIFGALWDQVKGALVYGYEFVKGLFAGLKEQVTDLIKLITSAGDVVKGLIDLGKSFYKDPKSTLKSLGEVLGQEAVDTFTKATQCGAYDLGKVIGGYVSPAFALKLASQLTKYSGKLADVAKALRHDFGCASFAAGTLVLTSDGLRHIESIEVGDQVYSRNELTYADRAQAVVDTFGRIAPSYRILTTELDSFKVTDEHPLWVQGKGWIEAAKVEVNDVLAADKGDLLVTGNEPVAKPLHVYNFSVALTANYFVGTSTLWVHNAGPNCSIALVTKAWQTLTPMQKGFRAEYMIFKDLTRNGKYTPVGKSFNPNGQSPDDAYKAWRGQTGIDGVYKDASGNYVIVESKATGGTKPGDPSGCKGRMCDTLDGRQMSDDWLIARLNKIVGEPERTALENAIKSKNVKKVYAQTDQNGTTYHEINDINNRDVEIGGVWAP
jgi:hypothetical protein